METGEQPVAQTADQDKGEEPCSYKGATPEEWTRKFLQNKKKDVSRRIQLIKA
jgi:hypothetical protein